MALRLLIELGVEPGNGIGWVALGLTYSLHALIWAVAAALLSHRQSLAASARHWIWRLALLGPFASAGLANSGPSAQPQWREPQQVHEVSILTLPGAAPNNAALVQRWQLQTDHGANRVCQWLAFAGVAAAALGMLRLAGSAFVLSRRLRARDVVTDTRLLQRLERMQQRFGLRSVRLSASANVRSPLVLGRSELCIPLGALSALSDAELDSVFAHELAHLQRGDSIWFLIASFVQSAFWLQPTNHWVAARLRESAELACDDCAVMSTGEPLALARALTHVAASALPDQGQTMLPGMARSRSHLLLRLKRLLDARAQIASPTNQRWPIVSQLALGLAITGLSIHVARAKPTPPNASPRGLPASAAPDLLRAANSPPDLAARSQEVAELARHEAELSLELDRAQALPDARREGSPASVRVLELSQELKHTREHALWLEARFVEEAAAWERRRGSVPAH